MYQYKILHRILPTNSKLLQYNIKNNDLCDFCLSAPESILHLFCECDITACIWEEIVQWYNSFGYHLEYLSDVQIILGDPKFDPIFNRIIILTKSIFFKNKSIRQRVTLNNVIKKLKNQFQVERFLARKNG